MAEFKHDDNKYMVPEDNYYEVWSTIESKARAGRGDPVFLFHFGVYTPTGVIVFGHHLEDALEIAAASGQAGGAAVDEAHMQELYEEAANALDLTMENGRLIDEEGEEVDWDDQLGNEVRETAEADLTYTESGWLDWNWNATELQPGKLMADAVLAWARVDPGETAEYVEDETDDGIANVLAVGAGADDYQIMDFMVLVNDQGLEED
jgi:hypothetical protein